MALDAWLRRQVEAALWIALEPERIEAWRAHIEGLGRRVTVEWQPHDLMDTGKSLGYDPMIRCCGRLRLENSPVDFVDVLANRSSVTTTVPAGIGVRTVQRMTYEDRFLIDPQGRPSDTSLRARGLWKRAFWLFGPFTGMRWRGGRLARWLSEDQATNAAISRNECAGIHVFYDKRTRMHVIARRYLGIETEVAGGLFSGLSAHVERHHALPSPKMLGAIERIAAEVRREAGLPLNNTAR